MEVNNFLDFDNESFELALERVEKYNRFKELFKNDKSSLYSKIGTLGYGYKESRDIGRHQDLSLLMILSDFKDFYLPEIKPVTVLEDSVQEIIEPMHSKLDVIKREYMEAVDKANASITIANEIKRDIDNLKSNYEIVYGSDMLYWDDEQLEEMNKLIIAYNDAVIKANGDVAFSKEKREELAQIRKEHIDSSYATVNEESKSESFSNQLSIEAA